MPILWCQNNKLQFFLVISCLSFLYYSKPFSPDHLSMLNSVTQIPALLLSKISLLCACQVIQQLQ